MLADSIVWANAEIAQAERQIGELRATYERPQQFELYLERKITHLRCLIKAAASITVDDPDWYTITDDGKAALEEYQRAHGVEASHG